MAQKKITDLTLRSEVTADLNLPGDDGIQSYRVTAQQIKDYILAAGNIALTMLSDTIFNGLTAVTPADDDYFTLVDTSDSNKTKKALVGSFNRAVYRSVTTTDSVGVSDETMKLSGASFTSTLPTAVGVAGKRYKFLHSGTSLSQKYTLATTSGQTIGGIASGSYILCTNGEVLEIESDGANWIIINHFASTPWISDGNVEIGGTTTNPTKATTREVDQLYWRREGSSLYYHWQYVAASATGAAAGSGDYKLRVVPSGALINTTVTPGYTVVGSPYMRRSTSGTCLFTSAATGFTGSFDVYDSTYVRAIATNQSSGGIWASGFGPLTTANTSVTAFGCVPITDWQP